MDFFTPDFLSQVAEGFSSTKYLAISSFVLLIYDHLTCLDQEFEFFWGGEWSLTRILYFMRPINLCVICFRRRAKRVEMASLDVFTPVLPLDLYVSFSGASAKTCNAAIKTSTSFLVFGMVVVEAILTTRVYFLWTHNRPVQFLVCGIFVVCSCIAIGFAGKAIHELEAMEFPITWNQPGCVNFGNGPYWPIFVPTFIIQTVLFAATVFRILRPMTAGTDRTVVNRLLRDGGIFYCAVLGENNTSHLWEVPLKQPLVSVGFTGIGSIMLTHPKIAMPALISNFLLATHSICASRLILSIHSLAADMGSDPTFLLSNIEISRIAWRPGKNENELIVDLGNRDISCPSTPLEVIHLASLPKGKEDNSSSRPGTSGSAGLHSTRIGMVHRNDSYVDLATRTYVVSQPHS
ncbi:uncharacterized protein FOMMEDRAFT_159549 [Fomitiporia mediterranea MF3/22]|uniref:uncharacterized protein n=1 Tax=Fomitiporia mediterranea (strain MF3/22) TaxID=694068 RepID=UPI0004409B5A|nr:uncharacterized protein FOMMEDRAFT_159549 [Fomitiporia mediterranea MF3/22]EJC99971.1 hypothetical protein FOMMEDRAFT_159549 [Fomitiporia mediterranea MF3/22]